MDPIGSSSLFALAGMRGLAHAIELHSEHLSSGQRVNRGADDPSGLAIASGMRARLRGQSVAIQNLQDVHNMLDLADGAIGRMTALIHRMRDLMVRGANDAILTLSDRQKMQSELDALRKELTRLPAAATFNSKHILSSEGASPCTDPPTLQNGRLTVTEATAWAGNTFYEDLKQRLIADVPGAMDMSYGMLGLSVPNNMILQMNFRDAPLTAEAIAVTTPAANTIRFDINVNYFTPQPPLINYPVFGNGTSSASTPETVLAHNMAQAITLLKNAAMFTVANDWAIIGYSVYQARTIDRIIEWNPAAVIGAIGGSLTSNPIAVLNPIAHTGQEQHAETGLAFQYIAETYGNDKIRDIINDAVAGDTFQNAVLKALPNYANFAQFEADADTWSLDYVNSGKWKGIDLGLGRTLEQPQPGSPQTITYAAIGPNSSDTLQINMPWVSGGALDYITMSNVLTGDAARRSLETSDIALSQLSDMRQNLGITQRRVQHIISDLNAEFINQTAAASRITDADMALEMTEFVKENIRSQTNQLALENADTTLRAAQSLLHAAMP